MSCRWDCGIIWSPSQTLNTQVTHEAVKSVFPDTEHSSYTRDSEISFPRHWTLKLHTRQWNQFSQTLNTQVTHETVKSVFPDPEHSSYTWDGEISFPRPWTLKLHMRQWDQFSQTLGTQVMQVKWIISSLSQTLDTQVTRAGDWDHLVCPRPTQVMYLRLWGYVHISLQCPNGIITHTMTINY